ncbi:MFS transporter [Actinoalloteichus caeruleus]|uniref:Arabinose efflux permease, MFS family n=1 Tax=Actinoalloteichus caeruleus DSM 43889 TaxID=1120930 RepID=A0ABT1JJN8_ACTCY|nr:MFS transporter [Actinoalloteichus caeruleus]MCP2332730.1 putative arabinose efflux permease, MFS family [Actinoalloteichus caeruleus DSM 43889]
MSHSASLADYRAALSTPAARWPVITSLVGRLPIAMIGMSILFYVRDRTGSFAIAGLVSAATLFGVAFGSVVQGRIVDRLGPTRPLLTISSVFVVLACGQIALVESSAPVPALVALALCIGLSEPQLGTASRALWRRLLPPGPARTAALSYEAISVEVFFILGPGLAGLLAASPWPGTGLVVGTVAMVGGSTGFALTTTVRSWRPEPRAKRTSARTDGGSRLAHLLGAFAVPGMRTVALAVLGFGVVIGFVEVAVPAAATEAGHPAIGGLLLSLWSVSSVVFGLLYGLRPWPRPLHLRLPVLLGGFAVLTTLLAVPVTLAGLAAVMFVVGALVTPQSMAHSLAVEAVAPSDKAAEAFGWVITSVTVGIGLGQSISGQLVENVGVPQAFLAAAGCGVVIAGLVFLFRGTVAAEEREPDDDGRTPRPTADSHAASSAT